MACISTFATAGEVAKAEHPFLLWTKADLTAMRRKIQAEAWAKKAYGQLPGVEAKSADDLALLFRAAVMDDPQAIEAQKKRLLSLLKARDPLGAALEWRILAYDLLYDRLTPDERNALEERFRRYITYAIKPGGCYDTALFNNSANYSRYDSKDGEYGRTNWLPNIIWPFKISANLMALVLRDEKLIRETWATRGSMKWYFDEYLCDSGFYSEEFSKMISTPGAMYVYCIAARNLGLDELGFGYKGKGGATMRGHIESVIRMTYPRIDLGTTRPQYPHLTIGDVRSYPPFQMATVVGFHEDGSGGNPLFHQAGAWGGTTRGNSNQWDGDKTEKMGIQLWFELGHKLWPDSGFGYFLAQMRRPEDDKFYPTLFFGVDPIDPAKVKAPPMPSAVYPERGLAILRHDESSAGWESSAPLAAMRLTAAYAHHVNDALALVGYYALNRPIYLNPKSDPGYAFGFSRSVRSHCSVMVDGHVKIDDWGKTGSIEPHFTDDCTIRQAFAPEVKFVAARTKKRYEGVDETRALMLTKEYLFDLFSCSSDRLRNYTWIVHTFGSAAGDGSGWAESHELADLIPQLFDERSLKTNGTWSVTARQLRRDKEPQSTPLGEKWLARKIGVRMTMLGESGTAGYVTRTPRPGNVQTDPAGLVNGVTILAARKTPATAFVAIHEAFEGEPAIQRVTRIAATPAAQAVAVEGRDINDRLLVRVGENVDEPVTLSGQGESFTFASYGFVRVTTDAVIVRGDVKAMKLKLAGPRRLVLNGKETPAHFAGGVMAIP